MTHCFAQVAWARTTGLPEDRIVNGFHFDVTGSIPSVAPGIVSALQKFYNVQPPPANYPIKQYLSRVITGHADVKFYDWSVAPPRIPLYTGSLDITPITGGVDLPSEVALCLSYKAAAEPGSKLARRRGRLYIGPLNDGALKGNPDVAGDARPTVNIQNSLVYAAQKLVVDLPALCTWSVYSTVDNVLRAVASAHCDDAFDTVRARGAKSTSRVAVTFPG